MTMHTAPHHHTTPARGQVLLLSPGDWRYHDGTRTLAILVAGVRLGISPHDSGEWL